MILWKGWCWEI